MPDKNNQNFKHVIELRDLSRSYGFGDTEFKALNNINFKVKAGEFVVVMGPSGCGKTTLLNVLGLIDEPSEGEYFLEGKEVSNLSSKQKARLRNRRIGLIFQNFNLIPRLNVIDNVALPLLYAGVGKTKRLEKASQILANFQLSEREYYMPWQISGGQIQRVAIARALVNDPAIILADEPTGNLDSKASHIVMEELFGLNQKGHTIIMVTHNPNLTSYADRVITMLDGRIISNKDNNSGQELVENAPEIELVQEEAEPKVTEIIVSDEEKLPPKADLIKKTTTVKTIKISDSPSKTTAKTAKKPVTASKATSRKKSASKSTKTKSTARKTQAKKSKSRKKKSWFYLVTSVVPSKI